MPRHMVAENTPKRTTNNGERATLKSNTFIENRDEISIVHQQQHRQIASKAGLGAAGD